MAEDGYGRVRAELAGGSCWHTLEHLAETTSTNDVAAARARDGAAAGLVVVADRQTAGRGRRGRRWEDRPGRDLLVSLLVDPPPTGTSLLPLVAGLAVADAVGREGVATVLKWPNDVLVAATEPPAKCAGILAERHDLPDRGPVVVLGIGIDLDWRGVERAGAASGWRSLAEVAGRDVDRWVVLADLLRGLAAGLTDLGRDPTRLLATYRQRCHTIDRPVRVATPGGVVVGTATAVDATGALVVGTADGPVTVTAGDVEHVRSPG